jgi:uncharacterized protein YndB with AHSA1/START domain
VCIINYTVIETHDGMIAPCMPRVQATFTTEMRGTTTASTAISDALHGGLQTAAAGGMMMADSSKT